MEQNNHYAKPSSQEIEISIFGPGYGESLVLHLTDNNWIVVDSCIDLKSKQSIPLNYLKQLGVSIENEVKVIIVSHWHDDHIRGVSELYKEAKNSKIVISSALLKREFLTYIYAMAENSMMQNSGVEEMYNLVKDSIERTKRSGQNNIKYAFNDKLIWSSHDNQIQLSTLSPSDQEFQNSLIELSKLVDDLQGTKRRAIVQSPNNVSIVLWVRIGNDSILLGSDMEKSNDENCGWRAISNCQVINNYVASFYKVAHHGSETGYDPEIWNKLLIPNPTVALTPFMKGRHKIPTNIDIRRICAHSTNFFATKLISGKRPIERPRIVEKQIKEIKGLNIKPVIYSTGHLRFRKSFNNSKSNWKVDLFNEAEQIDCSIFNS